MVNTRGLSKAAVLAALYNASRPLGMVFFQFDPTEIKFCDEENSVLNTFKKGGSTNG